jgi:hypothetical protein
MATDDPGWGGYVPEDEGAGAPSSGTPSPGRPSGRTPQWKEPRRIAIAAVVLVALFAVGAVASRLHSSNSSASGPSTSPTTPSTTTTPTTTTTHSNTTPTTTTPSNADFIKKADAICAKAMPTISSEYKAWYTSGNPGTLYNDLNTLISQLQALGPPPIDGDPMQTGLADWGNALTDVEIGEAQLFNTADFENGVKEFAGMGMRVCGSPIA